MKNIILYGAPAAGKGTQCELLVSEYGYKHISTGDLFRNLDKNTPLGKQIHETIAKGILVDDVTTVSLVKQAIDNLGNVPIVLDGFPRTINQAKILDTFFNNYIVVNLNVNREIAMKRTLGRLNCHTCGKIYNKYFDEMKPKKDNICDVCNIELTSRTDDNEESFNTRFNTYLNNVEEVLNYYRAKEVLTIVNSSNAENTFNSIKNLLGD